MNLRHIDPGSTDWMDAMLEGELHNGRLRAVKRETEDDLDRVESEPAIFSGATRHADAVKLGSRPPPGSR